MKEICKNCVHWEQNKKIDYEYEKNFGMCTHDKFEDISDFEIDRKTFKPSDDMVLYEDSENYGASMITGRNFGCIHFEEKAHS